MQTGRTMRPWDRPSFEAVPDPAGADWAKDLAAAPDQTQMLQDLLDKEGIVVLPAGRFYISAPLRINRNKGLIGAGMGQTVIIAKNPGMSMFVYDAAGKTRGMTLANLDAARRAGGRPPEERGCGGPADDVDVSVAHHVSNMSEAGVFVDLAGEGPASFDNNCISFCNFVQCASGLKQRAPRQGGWGFIDKLVAYRCQFVQCGVGVDFPAVRSNNACAYIECLFKGNTTAAARLTQNTTTTFANCDFVDNAGDPVVSSNQQVYFLSCRFEAGAADARSMLPSRSSAEGCVFEAGAAAAGAVVVEEGGAEPLLQLPGGDAAWAAERGVAAEQSVCGAGGVEPGGGCKLSAAKRRWWCRASRGRARSCW